MLISYAVCIYFVICSYSEGGGRVTTLSNIISNPKYQNSILVSMISMGIFTVLYEFDRKDRVSFIAMLLLLVGVYGVVMIEEIYLIHYVFTTVVLFSIFTFMFQQSSLFYESMFGSWLFFLLSINYFIMIYIIYTIILHIHAFFFVSEVIYVGCFGIFYLLLHAIKH